MPKGTEIRCMRGRYGDYVLIDDYQKSLLKDAVEFAKEGQTLLAEYAQTLANNLEKLKY